MTPHEDTDRRDKETKALYGKLRFLGLTVHAARDADRPGGYGVVVSGLKSLNPDHADRLTRRVGEDEAALAKLALAEWGPGLRAVEEDSA